MKILAIETSCDDTSAAVVENGTKVLSNSSASSCDYFTKTGGVIPEHAARKQIEFILPVLNDALQKSGVHFNDIEALAVTRGPGLLVSLLTGTTTARTLSKLWKKPLIGVHHTLGHLSSIWLDIADNPQFPVIALTASGGHCDLWLRRSHTRGTLLGRTRDDCAGEAFDKGAQMLSLPYPGGPSIAKAAEKGDAFKYKFPKPLKSEDTCDMSFSGLKTSLKYLIREITSNEQRKTRNLTPDLAASYQHAICAHLAEKIIKASKTHPEITEIHLAGGVSANMHLRSLIKQELPGKTIRFPSKTIYCTDNAAMIASAAYFMFREYGDKAFVDFDTEASLAMDWQKETEETSSFAKAAEDTSSVSFLHR